MSFPAEAPSPLFQICWLELLESDLKTIVVAHGLELLPLDVYPVVDGEETTVLHMVDAELENGLFKNICSSYGR